MKSIQSSLISLKQLRCIAFYFSSVPNKAHNSVSRSPLHHKGEVKRKAEQLVYGSRKSTRSSKQHRLNQRSQQLCYPTSNRIRFQPSRKKRYQTAPLEQYSSNTAYKSELNVEKLNYQSVEKQKTILSF